MKVTLMMRFNLYYNHKEQTETFRKRFRLESLIMMLVFSKYNPLAGRRYIKLPKELDHPRKELSND